MKKSPIILTKIIRFMALALLTGAMFIGCIVKAGTAKPVEPSKNFVPKITYAVSYDKLWDAIMIVLEKSRITVLSADKTSGIIQTDYFADKERRIAGGFLGIANTRWKCNLTLRNQSDGSIKLNITAKCEATTRGDEFFDPKKAPEQWHDVTSLNVQKIKNIETWFSEQIEKELNIGDGGEKEVKVSVAIPPAMRNENISNSEVLTNNSIVELVKAGISEEIVVNMIKTQPTRFDVSVGEILALKTNGVSEKIINEIVLCGKGTSVASVTSPSGSVKLNDGAKVVVPMIPAPATTNIIISDPAVEKLCESLEQDNPGKVIDALKKLRNMKATEAAPRILPCLTDSNPDVVREACRTLVVIGNQAAVPAIIPLLTNEKPDIIREACRTIAIIGNKDAIPAIEPLLMNSKSDIRDEAYKAITKLRAEP